jgi:hypothetical protein
MHLKFTIELFATAPDIGVTIHEVREQVHGLISRNLVGDDKVAVGCTVKCHETGLPLAARQVVNIFNKYRSNGIRLKWLSEGGILINRVAHVGDSVMCFQTAESVHKKINIGPRAVFSLCDGQVVIFCSLAGRMTLSLDDGEIRLEDTLTPQDLDEACHEAASSQAFAVNNGGVNEQMEYLRTQCGWSDADIAARAYKTSSDSDE